MMKHSRFDTSLAGLLALGLSLPVLAEPAGALDPTFDSDGKQTIGFDDLASQDNASTDDGAYAMELAPGGRIYLAGAVRRSENDKAIGLTRLKHDGSVDTSFGEQGRILHDIVAGVNFVIGSALQPDGKLVVAGYARPNGNNSELMVCRFDTHGARDPSFGNPQTSPMGCQLFPGLLTNVVNSVFVQSNGQIVLAGLKSSSSAMLVRLDVDGTLDTQFGDAGVYQTPAQYDGNFRDVTQLSDGDLVAVGHTFIPQSNEMDVLIVRLDQNGDPDLGFGPDGIKTVAISQAVTETRRRDYATGVHRLAGDALLVTGLMRTDYSEDSYFSYRPFALKLQPNGQLDAGFGGGIRTYNPCPLQEVDCSIETNSSFMFDDGRFLLAGSYLISTTPNDGFPVMDFFAMRLLSNGEPDPDFGSQAPGMEGTTVLDFGLLEPAKSKDYADVVLADGERILLAGSAARPPEGNQQSNHSDFAVARLDHGLDQTFEVSSESIGNGMLSPALHQNVVHSDHVEFEVTLLPGYQVAIDGCGGALYDNVYTTGAIVADCNVSATFKRVHLFSDSFGP